MSNVKHLLSRLDGVRCRGNGAWLARCPSHDDTQPSLSIRECDDGTLLLKCFAGCGAAEVVYAVGLNLHDLFPPRPICAHRTRPHRRPPILAWDVVRALRTHLISISLGAADLADGKILSQPDLNALKTAAAFVASLLDEVDHVR